MRTSLDGWASGWLSLARKRAGRRLGLSAPEWKITLLVGTTFAAAGYDAGILGLALPQIQVGLGIEEGQIGFLTAAIRLGIVPAFALACWADRVGRRRLLLVTICGFGLCHGLSALAETPLQFAALQLLAHTFALAEEMVAIVAVTEHVAARSRGLALGTLAALEDVGHGLAAVAFAALGSVDDGWRALYVLGSVPLVGVAWLRRSLRETPHFRAQAEQRARTSTEATSWQAATELVTLHRQRLALLVAATAPFGFAATAALVFMSKTLQEVYGYRPLDVTQLYTGLGLLLLPMSVVAGVLSDRLGRRLALAVLMASNALGIAWLYSSSAASPAMAWLLMMFGWAGCEVLLSAVAAELFPTSCRVTASGMRAISIALGGATGLWTESLLYPLAGSHALAVTWLLPAAAVSLGVVLVALPETAARELESLQPDPRPATERDADRATRNPHRRSRT